MGNLPILFSGALPDRYLLPPLQPFRQLPGETVARLRAWSAGEGAESRRLFGEIVTSLSKTPGKAVTDLSGTSGKKVTNLLATEDDARLKAACREFESIFIAELMRQVLGPTIRRAFSFQGEEGGLRGGATILAELMVEGFSKEIAASLDVGLAEKVYEAVSGRERVQTEDGGNNVEGRAEERR
ncbi:MAG TPA: hypothetical protein GX507_00345 [Clostridia bacterium]|nr:hypothetical protein [Clostridia bacterium]